VRSTTKSVLQLARWRTGCGEMALPSHAGRFSRRGDAQPPLFAVRVLRQFLRTACRGIVALVGEGRELRRALGLGRVPYHATPAHAAPRLPAGADKGPHARMSRPR